MPYRYIVGSNFPGCLPDSEPAEFETELDARNYMRDQFRRFADESDNAIDAAEFDRFADDMEFHGDAAMGGGDSYWDGPDGMVHFIECHDMEE